VTMLRGAPVVSLVGAVTLLAALVPSAGATSPSSSGVEYFDLDPGTPTQSGTTFSVPVFVIAEPAGFAASPGEVQQVWQNLVVVYLGDVGSVPVNWSVTTWGTGSFDLQLPLSPYEIASVESGAALLALNSSVVVAGSAVSASGLIDGAVLNSSIVAGAWWSTLFGIATPPPDPSFSSLQGIVDDLAWFGGSTAGRAAYAAATIVAILLYLWEGHKLARAKLLGTGSRREAS
jgi:hypothetical protein